MSADDVRLPAEGDSVPTLLCPDAGAATPGMALDLDDDEAAHVRSLRLRPGAVVELTDGRGGRWRGELLEAERRRARCAVGAPLEAVEPYDIELWVPVGNRDRSLWLVEKATEIGVRAIRLVEWERSRSVADAGRSAGCLSRAERRAIAALKQSGGSRLPEIEEAVPLPERVGRPGPEIRLLADRAGERLSGPLDRGDRGVILLVGPEGGATAEERDRCAEAGFVMVSLGPRILRFETAAIVGLSGVAAALEGRRTEGLQPPEGRGTRTGRSE